MGIIYIGKPVKEYSQEMLNNRSAEYTAVKKCVKCNTEVLVDTWDVYDEIYCTLCGNVKL